MCKVAIALIPFVMTLARAEIAVKGRVVDETNAPIAGARVRFSPSSGEISFSDVTGAFETRLPAAGRYVVDATREGFFTIENNAVEIAAGRELLIVLNHQRELFESVKVTAASDAAVDLERNHAERSLSGMEILDVPYQKDRNLRNALRLLPGMVQDQRGGLHFAGGAENQAVYTLDAFNVSDPVTGTFEVRLSVDAVRSVEYSSGYLSPDIGKGSAGAIAIQTKMGDDQMRYTGTNFVPGVDFHKGVRMGAWSPRWGVSGPIRRGRIWYSDSIDLQYFQTVVDELPKGQDTASTMRGSNLARVQANLTPSNILYASLLANYLNAPNSGLGPLDPMSTTIDRRARSWFFSIKDQIYFRRGALLEFGYGENRTFSRQIPQGDAAYQITPFGRNGNYFVNSRQTSARKQLLSNLFLRPFTVLGRHQVKAGIDVDTLGFHQNASRTAYEQLNAAGVLLRRTTFEGPSNLRLSNLEGSWYVMDGWMPRRNVRVEYGVRQDWDRLGGQWALSPRASISYAPWSHTRISAGYAVSRDATNLQLFSQPLDQRSVTTSFGANGRVIGRPTFGSAYVATRGKLGGADFQNWTFAVERRISRNLQITANLTRKRGGNGLTYLNTGNNTYELGNFKRDIYDSAELALRHSLGSRHEWMVSYARSRTFSNAVADVNVDQIRIVRNNYGRMGWDVPNRLISWGYLPTPLKSWSVAYLLETRSGFPFSVERNDGSILGDVNSYRLPLFFELDLHLEHRFTLARKRIAVRAGVNNISNHMNPTTVNSYMGSPNFLRYYGGDKRHFVVRLRMLGRE